MGGEKVETLITWTSRCSGREFAVEEIEQASLNNNRWRGRS